MKKNNPCVSPIKRNGTHTHKSTREKGGGREIYHATRVPRQRPYLWPDLKHLPSLLHFQVPPVCCHNSFDNVLDLADLIGRAIPKVNAATKLVVLYRNPLYRFRAFVSKERQKKVRTKRKRGVHTQVRFLAPLGQRDGRANAKTETYLSVSTSLTSFTSWMSKPGGLWLTFAPEVEDEVGDGPSMSRPWEPA